MRPVRNIAYLLLVLAFFGVGTAFVARNAHTVALDLLVPGFQFEMTLGVIMLVALLLGTLLGVLLGLGLRGLLGLARRGGER